MKTRWPLLLLAGLSALMLLMALSGSAARPVFAYPPTSNLPTRNIPTLDVPTLSVPTLVIETPQSQPTATRERSALTQPPTDSGGEDVAEPLLTLTALSGMAFNQPTATDEPSSIVMDGKPHMVDFNAFWCSPCNQMRPAVAALKQKYAGKITFDDINTDNRASVKLSQKYRVEFIPLMVLLDKDLKVVNRLEGYQSKEELDTALSALIANK